MCFMRMTCAIALQELLNICHCYSITVYLNFNALKSFCFTFTSKLYKLSLPYLHINKVPLSLYADSVKYLGFTFVSTHKEHDDVLRQMRTLYYRFNRFLKIFQCCSETVLDELGRSFCSSFYYSYMWTHYSKCSFFKFLSLNYHIMICTARY